MLQKGLFLVIRFTHAGIGSEILNRGTTISGLELFVSTGRIGLFWVNLTQRGAEPLVVPDESVAVCSELAFKENPPARDVDNTCHFALIATPNIRLVTAYLLAATALLIAGW